MTLTLGSSIVDAKKYSDSFVSLCGFCFFFFNSSIHLPHWHSIRDHFHAEKGSCSQSRFLYMMGQNPIVQTHNSSFSDGSPKGPEAPLRSCVRSVLDIF